MSGGAGHEATTTLSIDFVGTEMISISSSPPLTPILSSADGGGGNGLDPSYSATSYRSDVYSVGDKDEIEEWSTNHIRYFLSNIGLEHYYQLFVNNGWDNGEALIHLKESTIYNESIRYFQNIQEMNEVQIRQGI